MNVSGSVLAAKILNQITAVVVDFSGRVLFWNEGAEGMYHRSANEVVGQPLSNVYRCEFLNGQSEQAVFNSARAEGKWTGDCLHILVDGRRILMESEIAVLRDEADREIGFSIVIRHADYRNSLETSQLNVARLAEDEAKQQWEKLRGDGDVLERFLENLPVCAYVKDEKGRYLFNNRAVREVAPTAADYAGKTDEELFGPETGRAYRANDLAVLYSERPIQTIETLHVDGQECSFVSVKFPMTDAKGNRFVGGVSVDITDSVRDREKLRRQSALLDLSSNAILMVDLAGLITYWNQGAERLYGWDASEVIGRNSFEVLKGEFAVPFENVWEQYVREGYWEGEITVRTRRGEPIVVLTKWSLLRNANGEPVAGMGISTDVTETRIAFEELRRAEAEAAARASELSAIFDAMPAAIFITHDPECRTMTSSRFAHELLRLPHGANTSKSAPTEEMPDYRIIRDGKEIAANELPMQTAAATGAPVYNVPLTVAFEDGTSRDIFGHAVPLLDDNGQVRGAVGAFIDVTERNEAEKANRQHEAVLQSVMDATSDFIFMKGLDGRYLAINRSIADTLGKAPEEIIGKDDYSIFPADIAERFKREDSETIASGGPCRFENELLLKGRQRCLQTVKSLCRDPDGEVIGVVGISRDITERKELEVILQQRERDLTEAHRIAKLGTWSWTRESDKTIWSDEVFRTYARNSKLGEPSYAEIRAMCTPQSASRLEAAVDQALSDGTPYQVDLEILLPDGSTRWIVGRGEVEEWKQGKVASLRGTIQDISDRKRADAEIFAARQRLEALMNALPVGVTFSDDATCERITGNPAALAQFEVSGEENLSASSSDGTASGRKVSFYRDGGALDVVHLPLQQAVAVNREIARTELEVKMPSGRNWIAECYGAPVRDSSGNVVGGVAVTVDITDRKRVEQALRASESRFRKLFESGMLGIGIPDRFGGFSEANDELLRLTGYTRIDLEEGRLRWDVMTPPEYLELDAMHIAEADERGSCTPYEKEYIRKDGTRVPILCGYALLEGSRDHYIGFVQDLTPQKKAEAALRDREQRFRLLAESLPQLVWIRDANGQYLYGNQQFYDYLGISTNEMNTIEFEFVHPDDMSRTAANWTRSMQTGETYTNEYRLRRHDGEYRHFLARAVPVRDEAGRIQQWIGSSTDVHDQKLAEEALHRTERLNTAARFAASMAHEINNPLNSVVNSLYLALQDSSLHEATRELLTTAERELDRTAQVVKQQLRFHRQSTAPSWADLREVMDSVLAIYKRRLTPQKLTVRTEYRTNNTFQGFSDDLRQVFGNLISNSIDSMKRGGRLRIRISEARSWDTESTNGIRVTIADTGEGIPAELRKRVFEPFVTSKENLGTGLGLWVTLNIVRKHNGRITFRSTTRPQGHGTVFSVFLPRSDQS